MDQGQEYCLDDSAQETKSELGLQLTPTPDAQVLHGFPTPMWLNGEAPNSNMYFERPASDYFASRNQSFASSIAQNGLQDQIVLQPHDNAGPNSYHQGAQSTCPPWTPISPTTPTGAAGFSPYSNSPGGANGHAGGTAVSSVGDSASASLCWPSTIAYMNHNFSGLPPWTMGVDRKDSGYHPGNSDVNDPQDDPPNLTMVTKSGHGPPGSPATLAGKVEGVFIQSHGIDNPRKIRKTAPRSRKTSSSHTNDGVRSAAVSSVSKKGRSKKSSSRSSPGPSPAPASGPMLRTAARKLAGANPGNRLKPGESVEEQRARVNHNQVEKEYRNRLHHGFEHLLKVLPGSEFGSGQESEESSSGTGQQRRLSKVEVLDKACRRIEFLEGEVDRVEQEKLELEKLLKDSAVRDA